MKQASKKDRQQLEPVGTIEGVKVGTITAMNDGQPLVDFAGNNLGPLEARYTASTEFQFLQQAAAKQREVLLVFENNNPRRPIIIDILHSFIDDITEVPPIEMQLENSQDVTIDGKRITFNAREQIELRCGKSSIVLTRAGKIIIKGAYLLNRSSGVNRIKGGSVQIN